MTVSGGNTDELYYEGTLPKARMIVRAHPDCARLAYKWGRWHHHVDYSAFKKNKLLRHDNAAAYNGVDNYEMQLVQI